MKPNSLPLGALAALVVLASSSSAQAGAGGLRRVDPGQEEAPGQRLDQLFAREFDEDQWRARLAEPDLEQREQNLDALLKRAQLDPVARAFLEKLARDAQAGELAWTARLALRELGRARFPLHGLFTGPDALGMGDRMQEMQQRMQELFAQEGLGLWAMPSSPGTGQGAGRRTSGRSVHVEQTRDGARVEITETIDGEERTRTYEGKDLQEILRANEELADDLQGLTLRTDPRAPLDLRLHLGPGRERALDELTPRGRTFRLQPQDKSRPVITDRLGVVVYELGSEAARELGLEDQGLAVQQTSPGTYAHLLGVGAGDVLVELDGRPLRDSNDIGQVMRARKPDDPLTLVWIDRLGQRQEKTWRPQPPK